MTWRAAKSLVALEDAIKAEYPNRKTHDGFIGDAAHSRTQSDHNPNANGVVCADDVMADGIIDLNKFAEALRTHKDFRLNYVIWNRHITGAQHDWEWAPYTGTDPHTGHVHVSVKQVEADYDDGRTWNLGTVLTLPRTWYHRLLRITSPLTRGDDVKHVQQKIGVPVDGLYGSQTASAVKRWQQRHGLTADGIVGPQTARKIG